MPNASASGEADASRGEREPGIACCVDEAADPRPQQVRSGERGGEETAHPGAVAAEPGGGQQDHADARARVGRARQCRRQRVAGKDPRHLFNR